jgi:hypothetical protein
MNKLMRLTTLSFAIASLGATSVQAQETTPDPSGVSTPATPTVPATPATPATPTDSTTPQTPVAPTTMPMQTGVCNNSMMSSTNVDAASTYTVGPSSKSNSATQTSMSSSITASTRTGNDVAATTENTSSQTTAYSAGGYSADAPRLLKANSSVTQEDHEIGPSHHIELYSGINPLCYVSVQPMKDIVTEANESIRVFNKNTGNELDIKVLKGDRQAAKIVFAQPVAPRTTLEIVLNGIEYDSQTSPSVIQYSLAGGHVNSNQEIPYGVAQVNRHLY